MATKSYIPQIIKIDFTPYCPGWELALTEPGLELIKSRRHYITPSNMSHLAVKMTCFPDPKGTERGRRSRKTLFVNICDDVCGTVVSSRSVMVDLSPGSDATTLRVDIPLHKSEVVAFRSYTVRVVANDDREHALIAKELIFVPMSKEFLPSKFYSFHEAWIVDRATSDPRKLRECSPAVRMYETCYVKFLLTDNLSQKVGKLIELTAEIDTDQGTENREVALQDLTENTGSKDGTGRLEATTFFTLPECGDIVRIKLKVLGYVVASAVFSIAGTDREGSLKGDELTQIPDKDFSLADERLKIIKRARRWEAEMLGSTAYDPDATPAEPITATRKIGDMIGLAAVKEKIRSYTAMQSFLVRRMELGLNVKLPPLHAMFLGSPGTGKTTVATLMGEMLKEKGLLTSGHVVRRECSSLVGQYYGTECTKTLEAINEAQGGILLIDEAYQLLNPHDERDPVRRVVDTLITHLSDESKRDWMLILCGYTKATLRVLHSNQGLASRIPMSNVFIFEDFTPDELMEIARKYFDDQQFILSEKAAMKLRSKIDADYAHRGSSFGNARYVMTMIETRIIPSLARRVEHVKDADVMTLSTIEPEDIPALDCEIEIRLDPTGRPDYIDY